jgi:2,4-dienoyl-CoA reductase-like NADH-dependent reductase (Old Yellow Enzyme family)
MSYSTTNDDIAKGNRNKLNKAFTPVRLGPIELNNRFIKSATYEGMYVNGIPSQDLINHHVEIIRGGTALTTVSYGAVSPEGRTFKDQMWLNDESLAELKKLSDAVHAEAGKVSIQLTHCGFFSKNTDLSKPLAPSRIFNAYGVLSGLAFSKAMDESDLEKVKADFVQSTEAVKKAGFDAVEIHMGHGYLLSQFLSPATNKRKDAYGGSIENRSRFPLDIYKAVHAAVGDDLAVLVKLNLDDGFAGGFSLEDCKYVCRELEKLDCHGIELSGGFTSKTPFYLMRGDIPLKGMIENGESIAEKLTMRLFGPTIIKEYKFEPNFFLKQAKEIRKIVETSLIYLGGVNSKDGITEIMNSGFEAVAIARPLIYDSEFVNKLKSGAVSESGCNRCNECVVEMDRGGVRCTQN